MEFKVFERLWWATPVWECIVTNINNKLISEYCLNVKNTKPGITISNKGGWHSGEVILPIPQDLENLFNDLTIFVNDVTSQHVGTSNLILGNWWININNKYDYNTPHDHQNSILSGVYYVSVPESNMGDLILHRGDNAEFFLTSKVKREDTMSNSLSIQCPVEESKFYLFPSWVKHSVERNNTNSERISIAFNFISL
jgi:uncharacterized protein (TIGR02466 family)